MGKQWIKLGSVSSTNSYISSLLAQRKDRESLLVMADYQEAGRGQGSHSWHSRTGENLLMSLLLFPAFLSASDQFQLSRVVSLAICDTLEALGVTARIKWPNDILTDKGKIAGILIEHGISGSKITHSILGIGLNLNQTEFPPFPVPASSVLLENGQSQDPEAVARMLEQHIHDRYERLKQGASGGLESAYLDKLHLLNQEAGFRSGGETSQGMIRGVNVFGELLIESNGVTKAYGHGEIEFIQ